MIIGFSSVFVDDQSKALDFYTKKLGFVKKTDAPAGEYRWLTVVSPERPDGVELLLEPNVHPAAKAFQESIVADGIPATSFTVKDMEAEYKRLSEANVSFVQPPTAMGPVTTAVFDDTCGNLIQIMCMNSE
jgi:predicted enzyme related to lactoylglutathione lyase